MRIAAPFTFVLGRRFEVTERHASAGRDVVEINVLLAFPVRVGVVEYPLLVGQVGIVPVESCNKRTTNQRSEGS